VSKPFSVHPLAEEELDEALAWYDKEAGGGGSGDELVRRFVRYYAKIEAEVVADPERWAFVYKDYRRRVFTGWPYSLIYYATEAEVRIIALAHGWRRPLYWRNRR